MGGVGAGGGEAVRRGPGARQAGRACSPALEGGATSARDLRTFGDLPSFSSAAAPSVSAAPSVLSSVPSTSAFFSSAASSSLGALGSVAFSSFCAFGILEGGIESSKVVTVLGRTGPVGTWGGSVVSIGVVLFISMTDAEETGAVTVGSELAFVVGLAGLCGGSDDAAGRRCSRAFRVASSGTSVQM